MFVCFIAVVSFYGFRKSFIQKNMERLHAFSSVNEKRIVAVGTSLLGHATFFDQFMSEFGKEKNFDEFKYLQITKGGGFQEDFIPLMRAITEANPNIVIIESNLVLLDLDKSERLKLAIRHHKKRLRHSGSLFLRAIFGTKQEKTELRREAAIQQTKQDSVHLALRKEFSKSHFEVRDTILPKEIEVFLLRAKELKIRTIIVDIPRFRKLEEVITQLPLYKPNVYSLIQELQTKYGVTYLKFPEELGLEYYEDFSHLNQKGRERYSYWLLSCLSKL